MSALITTSIMADTSKPEKTVLLKNHVVKMNVLDNESYRLELRESAAAYHAEEKFVPCLQKAMKENKKAHLTVGAFSLKVLDCKNE